MTGTRLPALEEGAAPPEVPYPEVGPDDPSPKERVDLGPLGTLWTDGPKSLWAWQPKGGG